MMATWVPTWFPLDGLVSRHPYLDVTLFEFCYTLPWRLKTSAGLSKPVLRHAFKGLLPEKIRRRPSKGTIDPRVCWAFVKERPFLHALIGRSILAEMGWIERSRVLQAIDAWGTGRGTNSSHLFWLLSLELWLSTQAGRFHDAT